MNRNVRSLSAFWKVASMNFDPLSTLLSNLPTHDDEWALYQLFTRFIFDTLVRDVVRGHYEYHHPSHVTLHLENGQAALFVREGGRTFLHQDDALYDWLIEFLTGDFLNLPTKDISTVYLDGPTGGAQPYLYILGDGLQVATGEPAHKGKLL